MATQPPAPQYLTNDQILASAQQQATAAQAPQRADIAQEAAAAAAQTQRNGADIQGFSSALAQVLSQIAPQISQTYSNGAKDQAAFGKGFSDGLKLTEQGTADSANEILKTINAPEGQFLKATGASADVAYGLGGYLPAKTFSREGAAFSSAASFLPATALLRGQQDFAVNIAKGRETQKGFERFLQDLDNKYPDLLQGIIDKLNSNQLQVFATQLQAKYLDLATADKTGVYQGKPTLAAKTVAQRVAAAKAAKVEKAASKKQGAWDNFNAKVPDAASGFFKEVKNPNPAAGLDPSIPLTITKPTKSRTQAFNVLWVKYGKALVAAGADPAKVKAAINASLTSAGYPKPKKAPKLKQKGGTLQQVGDVFGWGK